MTRTRRRLAALLVAAFAAGSLSTVAQITLWIVFADAWPTLLARDARLAAALILGQPALPPPMTFDATVLAVAAAVHAVLSLLYMTVLAFLVDVRPLWAAWTGALFGVALYVVNMFGFTAVFPWFMAARDWITAVAHIAFGVSGAVVYGAFVARTVR